MSLSHRIAKAVVAGSKSEPQKVYATLIATLKDTSAAKDASDLTADEKAFLDQFFIPDLLRVSRGSLGDDASDEVLAAACLKALGDLPCDSLAAGHCTAKMVAEGLGPAAVRGFQNNLNKIIQGDTGLIPEKSITAASGLPTLEALSKTQAEAALIRKTVVLKLNGGLGTGMGLSKAKSLLTVKDGNTFLDFIAKQVLHSRKAFDCNMRFMLMNSFSTSDDTKKFVSSRYAEFNEKTFDAEVEVMQSKVPKIDAQTLQPAAWPADKECEWCPPGHGELYAALTSTGTLDKLLADGFEYAFVSNSDNLGATLDLGILAYLNAEGKDFVMEVCERTEADKKGGHLAVDAGTGALLLRESAQCPKEDEGEFQNIGKHRYFNTNNLWVNLKALKALSENYPSGVLPLPVIKNSKTVDPTNPQSTKVFQLENAMGTAIQLFAKPAAVVVPRSRFAPVKTCNDLLSLRSDVYQVTEDQKLVLHPERNGIPPVVSLEDKHYKFVSQFEELVKVAVPSLLKCKKVQVVGPLQFAEGVVLEGEVKIVVEGDERKTLAAGKYTGEVKL